MAFQSKPGQEHVEHEGGCRFARRALIASGIAAAVVLALLLLWYSVEVFLLVFAAVLLAVFLRALSDPLSKHTGLSEGWSLAAVTLTLGAVIGAAVWMLAPSVAAQVDLLADSLPRSVRQLSERLAQYGWGRRVLAEMPGASEQLVGGSSVLARATGVVSMTLGVIVDVLIVFFVGLYLAVRPRLYTEGMLHLLPLSKRTRAREVIENLGQTLRRWLVGRALLMASNGVLTALGLWLLGVPLALTLGLLAGLLNFIPNIGPIVAGVPAVAVALMQGPQQALYVFLLYVALQTADGYVFTPLVQQRTVSLPPVLTIIAQVLMGVLFGFLGLLLATPLAAALLVLVKMLYVEDVLVRPVSLPSRGEEMRRENGGATSAG